MSPPSSRGRPPNPLERFTAGGWSRGLLRLALGLVLVALVLRFAGGDSWRHLEHPGLLPLIATGALIHVVQRMARIRKWQLMIAPTSLMQRSFSYLLRIQLIGMVANLALPVSEAVKVWAVSRNAADARLSAKSIVLDLCLHTSLIGLVGVTAAALAGSRVRIIWAVSLTMLAAPLTVLAVARRWPLARPESGGIADVAPTLWGFAMVETICQVSIYAIAFGALGVPVEPLELLALAPVLYIVDLLNFTPSGLGLREALFAGVLQGIVQGSSDIGVAAGLLISSMLLLATLGGGGLALLIPAPTEHH